MASPYRILLIDDNAADRELYKRALIEGAERQYDFLEASTAREGTLKLNEQSVDCVLLDYRLPDLNGVEFLIASREQYPNLPIIMLTGHGDERIAVDCMQRGAHNYLVKSHSDEFFALLSVAVARALVDFRIRAEKQHAESELVRLARYDDLTGLANRSLMVKFFRAALARAERLDSELAVIFLDLDNFKTVNETAGHLMGDELLIQVAQRLSACVREGDLASRFGGDEFILILEGLKDIDDCARVAQKIVDAMSIPFELPGREEVILSFSMGIATYPKCGRNADTLLKHSDVAMRRAKSEGKNRFCFFTEEVHQEVMRRASVEIGLSRAIRHQEFVLHYQPQFDLRTRQIYGMEALIRWEHPELGLLGPEDFIEVAEECGAISSISHWVLETACAAWKQWEALSDIPLTLSVNISARQLHNYQVVETISEVLDSTGLNAQSLTLELTETGLIRDPKLAYGILKELDGLGVKTLIDDFGMGYSSLAYLKRFPISGLKIDRAFIQGLPDDTNDVAIALAIITMAHTLGLKIIAEGIETERQYEFLLGHGCQFGQGFHIAMPMDAEQVAAMLSGNAQPN